MVNIDDIKSKPIAEIENSSSESAIEESPVKYKNKTEIDLALQKERLFRRNADRLLRDKYSFKAYKIVKKSLWGWAILLFIYGLVKLLTRNENNGHGFEVFSDTVLIAITSATTLNIFAAFLSLVKGLFPSLKE